LDGGKFLSDHNFKEYSLDPVRSLTRGYILALFIIAAMSITIHVIMDRILVEQDLAATIVSKSAAENTQIHMIVNLATEFYYTRNPNIVIELEQENGALKNIHAALVKRSQSDDFKSGAAQIIRSIYFEQPHKLDVKISMFANKVDNFIDEYNETGEINADTYNFINRQSSRNLTQSLATSLVYYENAFLAKVQRLRMVQIGAIMIICITLMLEAFAIFMPLVSRVSRYAERLHEISMTDMLTGIGNRRYFLKRSRQEIKRAARMKKDLCLCMIDIDHFKPVNDTHGHAAGDYVLREFVEIIKSAIRLEDDVARIGGEEFILLLPASDIQSALIVAERVRQRLEERPFVLPDTNQSIKLTASFGLSQVKLEDDEDVEVAMSRADEALYLSKETGRNRITYSDHVSGGLVPVNTGGATEENDPSAKVATLKPVKK
jgi:diguanylate cyclase (GGDEF)-like protein|tara:strand:- start:1156 stop:2457 length:1302 start_codon:yes stop_codon:yes gene_type:complete